MSLSIPVALHRRPALPFPRLGLSKLGIYVWLKAAGGPQAIEGKDCTAVTNWLIKPMTADRQCSVCDVFASQGRLDLVGPASVFVSHAWKQDFSGTLAALRSSEASPGCSDPYFWIDMFSINQHAQLAKDATWLRQTLHANIATFGKVMLVMDYTESWKGHNLRSAPKFLPLTRAWCLWEVVDTSRNNIDIQVEFDGPSACDIACDLVQNAGSCLESVVARIDLRTADAFLDADRQLIVGQAQECGIDQLSADAQAAILDGTQRCIAAKYACTLDYPGAADTAQKQQWLNEWQKAAASLCSMWQRLEKRSSTFGLHPPPAAVTARVAALAAAVKAGKTHTLLSKIAPSTLQVL